MMDCRDFPWINFLGNLKVRCGTTVNAITTSENPGRKCIPKAPWNVPNSSRDGSIFSCLYFPDSLNEKDGLGPFQNLLSPLERIRHSRQRHTTGSSLDRCIICLNSTNFSTFTHIKYHYEWNLELPPVRHGTRASSTQPKWVLNHI